MTIGFEMLIGDAQAFLCQRRDALESGLLGDFDVGKHIDLL
jgi:hypothetical protein